MLKKRRDIPKDPSAPIIGFTAMTLVFACLLVVLWVLIALVRVALG